MSISSEIERIKTNIANAYIELENKSATIPSDKNSNNLASTIASVSSGSGESLYTTYAHKTANGVTANLPYIANFIKEIDVLDLSASNSMQQLCLNCVNLETIREIKNTSNIINMNNAFIGCSKLVNIPDFDTSKVTNFYYSFKNCTSLKKAPQIYPKNAMALYETYSGCSSLEIVPLIDCGNISSMRFTFSGCKSLKNLGGFKDLGKAYTVATENKSEYKLDLSPSSNITHDSLMNVINNLYDLNVSYGGTAVTQQLILGATNIAKLTSDEIAIATNKGWTVS